ncbi:MAG TPA: general stress protein [Gemmataceae bacterium]|nr:general stress protein [Gemmataceae bacterium]
MNSNDPSAIAVYDDWGKAEHAVDDLRRAGFQADEIGIIGHVADETVPRPVKMHAQEDTAITGLIRGAILGAVVGAFVMLVIPGLGEVAGFGRWFDVLGGAILSAVSCGVAIAFGSFFFTRPRSRLYGEELAKGNFIVTVKNPQRRDEAASVLSKQPGAHVES